MFVCVREADLSRGFNAPDETEKDDKPGHSQAAQDRETDLAKVSDIIRDVQHVVSDKKTQKVFTCLTFSESESALLAKYANTYREFASSYGSYQGQYMFSSKENTDNIKVTDEDNKNNIKTNQDARVCGGITQHNFLCT